MKRLLHKSLPDKPVLVYAVWCAIFSSMFLHLTFIIDPRKLYTLMSRMLFTAEAAEIGNECKNEVHPHTPVIFALGSVWTLVAQAFWFSEVHRSLWGCLHHFDWKKVWFLSWKCTFDTTKMQFRYVRVLPLRTTRYILALEMYIYPA